MIKKKRQLDLESDKNDATNPKIFRQHAIGVLTGTITAQAIPLIGTLLIARLYQPAHFGNFAAWLGIVMILAVLITGRFEASLAVVDDGADRATAFFATLATTTLLGFIAASIATVAIVYSGDGFGMSIVMSSLIVPAAYTYALSQSWESLAAANGSYRWLSIIRIIQASIILVLQLIGGFIAPSSEGLALAFAIGIGTNLLISFKAFPVFVPKIGSRWLSIIQFWKKHRRFPTIALPADTLSILSSQLPIFIIGSRFGSEYAGYWAMTNRLLGAPVTLLGRSVLDVFKRYASVHYREHGQFRNQYLDALRLLAPSSIIFLITVLLFGKFFFDILLGPKWAMAAQIAIWVLPVFALRFIASPLSYTFYIVGKQHLDLLWQAALCICVILTFNLSKDLKTSIIFYSFSYSLLYTYYLYLSYRCSHGKS